MNNAIQSHIDIYVSQHTFTEVTRAFPYLGTSFPSQEYSDLRFALVSREFASGGGDVPEFKWHIIDEKVPFEIGDTGIQVLPFAG